MQRFRTFPIAVAVLALSATGHPRPAQAQDATRTVASGGISVPGWKGMVDPTEASRGMKVDQAKLGKEGDALHVATGPAVTYWNAADRASGDYTVEATFTEPKFMNRNDHPHPYGIVIAGNGMGTDQATYLYCAAYGSGTFIVRGFGPKSFHLNGRGQASSAVHKAPGPGKPVTQHIAMSVKGDQVSCAINGTVVATYAKADLMKEGLKSTDGAYGIRFAHNTEGLVTGLSMTRNK